MGLKALQSRIWKCGSGSELSVGGYTAGGPTLAGKAATVDGTDGKFTATSPIAFGTLASGATPSHAVMYKSGGTDATNRVIMAWVLGDPTNGGTYSLTIPGTGLLRIV